MYSFHEFMHLHFLLLSFDIYETVKLYLGDPIGLWSHYFFNQQENILLNEIVGK